MPRRLLASLVVSLLVVVAVAAVTHGQSGEYKIGVLEPLTGPLAGEGKRHLEGYEIVRDMINARGGVMGKKLVFAVADAPDPTAAAGVPAPGREGAVEARFRLTFRSTYRDLAEFLDELPHVRRLLTIRSVAVKEKADAMAAEIELSAWHRKTR